MEVDNCLKNVNLPKHYKGDEVCLASEKDEEFLENVNSELAKIPHSNSRPL